MSDYVILIISLAVALLGNIFRKYFSDKTDSNVFGGFLYNAVVFAVSAVVLVLWGGFGNTSWYTALLGLIFGVMIAINGVTYTFAIQSGPLSYTTVIVSFSTILTALSGMMFFNENISWAQVVGIILMIVSFVIAADNGKGQKRANLKWLLLCLAAFASQGGIGLMQKIHQSSAHKGELNSFLIIAFIVSAIASASVSACLYGKERGADGGLLGERGDKARFAFLMITVMVLAGACMASNHKLNLYLSGVMDSAVFFPIVNGGGLVLTTLAAVLLFRERLSKKQWVGLLFGIASVVFLCNPFA